MKINIKLKNYIFLISYAIILYFTLSNFSYVLYLITKLLHIFTPFIYGFVIAYIVNWPYEFFKNKFYDKKFKNNPKFANILSFISAYIMVFGIIAFVLGIIAPQLILSIEHLVNNFSKYVDSLNIWVDSLYKYFKINFLPPNYTQTIISNMEHNIEKFTDTLFPSVFNFTRSFALGIYNLIIGTVISFYLIGSKEKLLYQFDLLISTYIPEKISNNIFKIFHLSHDTFGKFIMGKFLDSLIIGILCFIGMIIFKIPYSILISVVVGVTNIIPFFGPFIGAIPCIFILLIVNPIKALWFTIFIIALQQIDGNIIGPKILGNSVGISGMWIMFSVIIGGGLFGITGMIVGVPIFAVIYTIMGESIRNKQEKENLSL